MDIIVNINSDSPFSLESAFDLRITQHLPPVIPDSSLKREGIIESGGSGCSLLNKHYINQLLIVILNLIPFDVLYNSIRCCYYSFELNIKEMKMELRMFRPSSSDVIACGPYTSPTQFVVRALLEGGVRSIVRLPAPLDKKPALFANQVRLAAARKGFRVLTATHGVVVTFIHDGEVR